MFVSEHGTIGRYVEGFGQLVYDMLQPIAYVNPIDYVRCTRKARDHL